MRTSDKIKILFKSPVYLARKIFYGKPNVMSDEQTLDYICENKCSVARFGDGELDLMCGASIKFQRADKQLCRRLKEVALSNDARVLICVPDLFGSKKELNEKLIPAATKWWRKHMFVMSGNWYKFFRAQSILGDTQISRFYVDVADKSRTADYIMKLKKLWDGKNIVFVEGPNSRLGVGNDLFDNAMSIRRIICPPAHAFDIYEDILDKVKELTNSEDLIICALGPTATVLSYDLALSNRRCLDLGHVDIEYEWYLRGVTRKIAIDGKEVYEAEDEISGNTEQADGIIYSFI